MNAFIACENHLQKPVLSPRQSSSHDQTVPLLPRTSCAYVLTISFFLKHHEMSMKCITKGAIEDSEPSSSDVFSPLPSGS